MKRIGVQRILVFKTLALMVACFSQMAHAQSCPSPLDHALRLIMVTTETMETQRADLRLFKRATVADEWVPDGPSQPAVVGRAGLGWGFPFLALKKSGEPEKVEGDKRSPAGIFRVGPAFGFSKSQHPGYIQIIPGETVCVEDPGSPHYNTITTRSVIGRDVTTDEMGRTPLYRHGLFIEYPSDRITRRGSCIFLHIWAAPDHGTSGCVALPEERVRSIQEFAQPGAAIAILPKDAIDRFGSCLPRKGLK